MMQHQTTAPLPAMPRPPRRHGGVNCDVDDGPCACSAWHKPGDADAVGNPVTSPITPEAAVLAELRSAGPLGLDIAQEIVPRLAERGIPVVLTLGAVYGLEAQHVVSLDGNCARLPPPTAAPDVRALAAALGFLPSGAMGSAAERTIAEHLALARLVERERLAGLLRAKADDAHDTAARLRRAGDPGDMADSFAGHARVYWRAADIAVGNAT